MFAPSSIVDVLVRGHADLDTPDVNRSCHRGQLFGKKKGYLAQSHRAARSQRHIQESDSKEHKLSYCACSSEVGTPFFNTPLALSCRDEVLVEKRSSRLRSREKPSTRPARTPFSDCMQMRNDLLLQCIRPMVKYYSTTQKQQANPPSSAGRCTICIRLPCRSHVLQGRGQTETKKEKREKKRKKASFAANLRGSDELIIKMGEAPGKFPQSKPIWT
ncbi:hypothetical protein B0F90DRAFT_661472 [Multifurca ochricompacta]|uniref:Uncharacterized protein n=1 Tax=Multifurca ochricompacta TaxID=376703 RepID=A0AAD4QMR5_9AGAM|nr:hypothetical protein B0F90DRAFT_661472 [Multifurca ochricompacta]